MKAGPQQPVYCWDPVISPSSVAFYSGDLFPQWKGNVFVTSSARRTLHGWCSTDTKVVGEERLMTDRKERLRLVRQAPDGALWVLTDGAKGKNPAAGDAGGGSIDIVRRGD